MKSKIVIIIAFFLLILLFIWKGLPLIGYYLGEVRYKHVPLNAGNIQVPHKRTFRWQSHSELTETILKHWASQKLPDWQKGGKTKPAKIIMAKLALNQDIEAVNKYLQKQLAWGKTGSTWLLHPEGDYDFTLSILTAILFLFGDEPNLLFLATREHLLSELLIEEGGKWRVKVPRSLGLVRDTENHLLMTEGSRYLKNRWLQLHGNKMAKFDNKKNGLETWLLNFLEELSEAGLYEFNSQPYMSFTLRALLNLESFSSDTVRQAARNVLDRLNWEYALGSFKFRRFAPFRRQLRRAGITSLNNDYHTALMKVWMSCKAQRFSFDGAFVNRHNFALYACLLNYTLPDRVADWVEKKPANYFIKIGHGAKASPEIYSGGPGYLLTSGGVHRGWRSLVVARPITLMLDDFTQNLEDVIYLAGPGDNFTKWNNTGVYKKFACAAGPVHIPKKWIPAAKNEIWSIYQKTDSLSIAVFSQADLGIICIYHTAEYEKVLDEVSKFNHDINILYHTFYWEKNNWLSYDVNTAKNKWVIISDCGNMVDPHFDNWALMEGEL